jgi:peptide/nickel transport system substrate-binding protein
VRNPRNIVLTLLLLAAAAIAAAGCGGSSSDDGSSTSGSTSTTAAAPTRGGTLKLVRAFEPTQLDPLVGDTSPPSGQIVPNIAIGLLEQEPVTAKPVPGLAESWRFSDGGRTITFALRDAQFSDGSPVTADDVKFSLEGDKRGQQGGFLAFIGSIDAVDARTVRLNLTAPTPAALAFLSSSDAPVVSKAVYQRLGARQFAEHPVAAGPFMLKSWTKGQRIELVRNPRYWRKGLPYLDGVSIQFVPDDNTRNLLLTSGQADANANVPFSQVEQLKGNADVAVTSRPLFYTANIFMNLRTRVLADTNARLALLYAMPRDAINKVAYAGLAEPANSIIPKNKYWDESVPVPAYDLAKARGYLARSPTPNGFSVELDIVGTDTVGKQTAAILQDAWQQIGVDVKINQLDAAAELANFGKADFELLLTAGQAGASQVPIDDMLASGIYVLVGGGLQGYRNAQVAELVRKATTTQDEAGRKAAFGELQAAGLADPVDLPIVFVPGITASRADVHGFQYLPTAWWQLAQVYKTPAGS